MTAGEDGTYAPEPPGRPGPPRLPRIVAHRGASALLPEHTLAAYERALADGADGLECDVRLTADGHLVCIHDRTVDRTSDGAGAVSEMTLDELVELDFSGPAPAGPHGAGAAGTGPAAGPAGGDASAADVGPHGILELTTLIELALDHPLPVKLFIETKHPVRYGGLVESKVLEALARYGLAAPASASHSLGVVISFSPAAVWRIRRAAPLLPTVLLGDSAGHLGRGAATAVGATAVGPSVHRLRADPELVYRAAAAGRATYCWTVDEPEDVELCRELGVGWIATNDPGRTRRLLER